VLTDLAAMTGLTGEQLFMVVLALPYVAIVAGRLQPRKNVEDWRDAYHRSEANRALERETNERVLGYLEAADSLLRSIVAPHSPTPPHSTSRAHRRDDDDASRD
jgi:hypothetical protein